MRYWMNFWQLVKSLKKELRKLPECEQGCSLNFVQLKLVLEVLANQNYSIIQGRKS